MRWLAFLNTDPPTWALEEEKLFLLTDEGLTEGDPIELAMLNWQNPDSSILHVRLLMPETPFSSDSPAMEEHMQSQFARVIAALSTIATEPLM